MFFMTDLIQHIKELEESLLRRHTRSDIGTLSALLHDDFEEIGSAGKICKKAEAIEWLLREDDGIQWSLSDFRGRQLADNLVLATYNAHKSNQKTGVTKRSIRCSLWKNTRNGWAMIFHQGTNMSDV